MHSETALPRGKPTPHPDQPRQIPDSQQAAHRARTEPSSDSACWRLAAGPGLWLLATAVFVLLALGPVLHVGGRNGLLPGGREISLPYGWLLRVVPFLEITRVPSRFAVMLMLTLGVLAAAGLNWVVGRRALGWRAGVVAVGLILFEFLPVPYPVSGSDTPSWYLSLAADPGPGSVLNLPMDWDRPRYLLYQTVHEKPLAAGYISRDDPRTLIDRAPVLQHFRHLGPDIIAFDLAAQGQQVLSDLGIRWVVLDRYQMPESPGDTTRPYTERAAAQVFSGRSPIYSDDRLTVYAVAPPVSVAPYLILGNGWGAFDETTRTRAVTGSAELIVQAPAGGSVTLRVALAPGSAGLDLPVTGDGTYQVTFALTPGANSLILRALEPAGRVVVQSLALAP